MHGIEYTGTLGSFLVISVRLLQSLRLVHQLHFGTLGIGSVFTLGIIPSEFLSRVSILTRDIDIANLSVCPSVTFRYQMKTA